MILLVFTIYIPYIEDALASNIPLAKDCRLTLSHKRVVSEGVRDIINRIRIPLAR